MLELVSAPPDSRQLAGCLRITWPCSLLSGARASHTGLQPSLGTLGRRATPRLITSRIVTSRLVALVQCSVWCSVVRFRSRWLGFLFLFLVLVLVSCSVFRVSCFVFRVSCCCFRHASALPFVLYTLVYPLCEYYWRYPLFGKICLAWSHKALYEVKLC